jgi:hypothetical protein
LDIPFILFSIPLFFLHFADLAEGGMLIGPVVMIEYILEFGFRDSGAAADVGSFKLIVIFLEYYDRS